MNIKLKQDLPHSSCPSIAEVDDDRHLIGWAYGPNQSTKLYVIGHECGAICAVWQEHEQGALDEAVDAGLLDCLQIDEEDADEHTVRLGNASEPFDLSMVWIGQADESSLPSSYWYELGEAKGNCFDTLAS